MAEIHLRTAPPFRRPVERLASGALVLLAALLLGLLSAGTALAAKPRPASLSAASPKLSGVTETTAKLRVSGTVRLPANLADTARNRKKVRIAVTLRDTAKRQQSFTAKINAKRKYAVTKTTKLRGTLTVQVQARVGGKPSGKAVTKKVTVKVAAGSGTGGGAGGAPSGPTTGVVAPAGAEKLVGLFRLDEGVSYPDGRVSGTYFRMRQPNGGWLINNTSRSRDTTYTLLKPGTDGGLRTDAYQLPDAPLFDAGNNVTTRSIVEPERFFGLYFTVFTPTESGNYGPGYVARPVPVPEIHVKDGVLTGQTTAWVANWNGSALFNQGSPKPDGTSPSGTTPVSGTYDAATRRYVLEWTSLIQGGPFDGFGGFWHLEGTFVPAG